MKGDRQRGDVPGAAGDTDRPEPGGRRRGDLPRRLGDVLTPTLGRLAGGDEARAYSAWARAVGEPVSGGTRPRAFRRGQLTVECASSVWANELTYLGPQILRRMDEVAPGHPVRRFRFVVGRLAPPGQGSVPPATKEKRRRRQLAPDADQAARTQMEGVQDGRLRAAIEASLRRSSEEPPEAPGQPTPSG